MNALTYPLTANAAHIGHADDGRPLWLISEQAQTVMLGIGDMDTLQQRIPFDVAPTLRAVFGRTCRCTMLGDRIRHALGTNGSHMLSWKGGTATVHGPTVLAALASLGKAA